ncbi:MULTISPECIES: HhoA/HhoB/HtrA family serine endopeptidase [unclassified Synechocystis]|uniref:HhoA/HhoB/HtrA family serine endopeptidase n=1 Tax=unclassified Synechocystis TaxID=2640012 RepID=UPI00040178B3|nr:MULTISPECIES: HhoA/HhoB/HtrA family serine endopeptidase [unclassified Synechocystis]AIE73401.1 Protease Do [Synechocystis sp. PCC 6714]MCT0254237.1 trypsin-like peptidase domain-containing protein [Synechocystis sp. CS-94]
MKDISLHPSKQTPSKISLAYLGLVLVGMGIGAGGTFVLTNPQWIDRLADNTVISPLVTSQGQTTETQSVAENLQSRLAPREPSNFVVDVVQSTGPAVVRINAQKTIKTQVPEGLNDPFFQRFFGSQMPPMPNERVQRGAGSGFIVSDDGKIFTNAHVVDGADEVTVTLKDGRSFPGRVMGSDPSTDVAVVKIEADDLPTVALGNSDRLQVGEWAIAIGNPLGLDNTVTTGILSATGRRSAEIGVPDKRVEFIQTDAAINPGNSGGPLLNADGQVIGMNTAIIQNAQGIGFAIPINKAQEIAEQLIATGKVEHAYLGIQMVTMTPELQNQIRQETGMDVPVDKGVVIMQVMPNSPAAAANLQQGDVLQSLQGQAVENSEQVQSLVAKLAVGDQVELGVLRNGQRQNLTVTIGALPSAPPQ